MSPPRVTRLALSLLLVGLLASACLRLSTPDSFSCVQSSDCLSDERCSDQGVCKPQGTCEGESDCTARQVCTEGKCVAAECYAGNDAPCGLFTCDIYQRSCNHECHQDEQCKQGYYCLQAACIPAPNLANGKPCTYGSECASKACCGPTDARVCRTACGADGNSCSNSDECASGNCCSSAGIGRRCQSKVCAPQPLGAACSLPADCQTGVCVDGTCSKKTCKADTECGAGFCNDGYCDTQLLDNGKACKTDAWCKSESCTGSICHGKATSGANCSIDADCALGRVCCASLYDNSLTCSALDSGCKGGNGYNCALAGNTQCLSGMCQDVIMCTDTCKVDADCGTSPWGSKNLCKKNGAGKLICFPGCRTEQECDDNVDGSFNCGSGVCSGDAFSPLGVRLF